MPIPSHPLQAKGPFFERGSDRADMRWVCYGPFPPRSDGSCFPENEIIQSHFEHIKELGFNGLRLYQTPPNDLLELASEHGLSLAVGPAWNWYCDFLENEHAWQQRMREFWKKEAQTLNHSIVELIYIANEIPADLVRFMGPQNVSRALTWLADLVKKQLPNKLIGYANYPSTEYLELEAVDFTAFNVYLEDHRDFDAYVRRLQLHSPDRPLVLSEIGADSLGMGEEAQAELVRSLWITAERRTIAGLTLYTYSDKWWNHQRIMSEWAFGLVNQEGREKPLAKTIGEVIKRPIEKSSSGPSLSVIICTKNGSQRLQGTLEALRNQSCAAEQIIIVDDGSSSEHIHRLKSGTGYQLICQQSAGLSAARNLGARKSNSEWVVYTDDDCRPHKDWIAFLKQAISESTARAVGGPNLPPPPQSAAEAINAAAPGGPSHVMLNDQDAEHLPGCNLALHRDTLLSIGGFDEQFRVAGDDVDLCWRLLDEGHGLAYCANALVWHLPRPTIFGYLKQQWGYGKAERLLYDKHPARFSAAGEPRWDGVIYQSSVHQYDRTMAIYHGPMGSAPYQMANYTSLPIRRLARAYRTKWTKAWLTFLNHFQPLLRKAGRESWCAAFTDTATRLDSSIEYEFKHSFKILLNPEQSRFDYLQALKEEGWQISADERVDLTRGSDYLVTAEERFADGGKRLLVKSSNPRIRRQIS